jgi:hypothetical protein
MGDHEINAIEEHVSLFECLPETVIEQVMKEVRERCPLPDEFGLAGSELALRRTVAVAQGGFFKYTPPSADEIRRYREVDYPGWLSRMREALLTVPQRLNERTKVVKVRFRISNIGTVPANNAVVEIEAHGAASIRASQKPEKDRDITDPQLPKPPDPPCGHLKESNLMPSAMRSLRDPYGGVEMMTPLARTSPPERSRNAFYWEKRSLAPSKFLSLTCDEFRHRGEAEDFEFTLVLPEGESISGAVSCRVSAANLPEPVKSTVPITTVVTIADTESHVQSLIQEIPRRVRNGTVEIVKVEG